MPGVAGGVGGVAGGSGVVGEGLGGSTTQAGTGSPPVSGAPPSPSLTGSPSLAGPACAAATVQTLVSIDGNVAERIYRDELVGTGTIADQHQVEENGPLLKALARVSALAKGSKQRRRSKGAIEIKKRPTRSRKRCTNSSTRTRTSCGLRVLQGGRLLADIGGPYIIAPVGGSLRFHGRVVGSYLLSVQDDLGFVGLERRLVGVPLILHVGAVRVPLQGTTRTGSVAIPDRGAVVIRGCAFSGLFVRCESVSDGGRADLVVAAQERIGCGGRAGARAWIGCGGWIGAQLRRREGRRGGADCSADMASLRARRRRRTAAL